MTPKQMVKLLKKNGFEIETGRAQVALPLYRRYI